MIKRHFKKILGNSYCSASNTSNDVKSAKSFSEMPTISVFKSILNFLPGGKYFGKSFKKNLELINEEYGNIFKIPAMFNHPHIVITYNPDDFEKVFRVDGVFPVRYGLKVMEHYRSVKRTDIYGDYGSLFTSNGEKWSNIRSKANPILMHPATIKRYLPEIDEIAKEFVQLMKRMRNKKSEMPENFYNEILMWSLESVSAIELGRRFYYFDDQSKKEDALKFIEDLKFTIEQSIKFDTAPPILKFIQPNEFKKVMDSSDRITNFVMHNIDITIKDIKDEKLQSNNTEDSVLKKFLKIDKNVANSVIIDLILAGVDSTAVATLNTLYCLAKNQEKQEILRKELCKILPEKNTKLSSETFKNMPYLKAVIKESFRLYQIIQGTSRMITKDVILSGYHVAANTCVYIQAFRALQDERYYPEPQKFIPERWLREQNFDCFRAESSNPFVFLPFGFGPRGCIGKRIADLELETILANIIRNFRIEWHYPDMKIKSTFLNFPDSDMKFKVIDV